MTAPPPGFVIDAAPTSAAPPAFIPGAPKPNAAEDQQFKRDAAARAAADQVRQEEQFQITQARENQRDQRQATKDAQGNEYQTKSASFYSRMLQSQGEWANSKGDDQEPRGTVRQAIHDKFPNAENEYLNEPTRKSIDQAARNFISAQLRLESGASIAPTEFDNQYRIFFPMPGDGPDERAQKARAREQATEAMKLGAGPLADAAAATVQAAPDDEYAAAAKQDAATGAQGNPDGITGTVTDTSGPTPPAGGGTDPRPESFLEGVNQGLGSAINNAQAGIEYATGARTIGQLLGIELPSQRDRKALEQHKASADTQGTAGGRIAGQLIGSLPTMGVGNALIGGGIAGGLMAENPNDLGDVAKNVAFGVAGGKLGELAAPYVAKGFNALMPARAASAVDREVVAAGERQRIPVRQPDARPELRGQMAQAETSQHGGPMIREARAADQAAMEGRITEVGGKGNPADPYALGTSVQAAGQRYIAKTKQQATRLYDRAKQEAGGAMVTARNADAALDRNIAELKAAGENSNAGAIRYLEGLRDDIDRGLTIEAAQSIRSNMRGQISERGLTGTDTERRVGQVVEAMTQDLTEQLPEAASSALRAADKFYADRQGFINGVLKQVMGSKGQPLPAETAAQRVVSMAQGKGNFDRFSRLWGQLEQNEQADVAATIASSLGRKANGEFSASTLVRSLDPRQGINPRTARLIFGADGAQALQDLRILAQAKTETAAALNNSRTGGMVNKAASGLKTLLAGALGFAGGGPTGAVAGGAAQSLIAKWGEQRAAKMLLNPDFTRWLRNAPNSTNPQVINRYFERLSSIGSIAANDNQAFVAALRSQFSQSPGRAAAENDQNADNGRRKPPAY